MCQSTPSASYYLTVVLDSNSVQAFKASSIDVLNTYVPRDILESVLDDPARSAFRDIVACTDGCLLRVLYGSLPISQSHHLCFKVAFWHSGKSTREPYETAAGWRIALAARISLDIITCRSSGRQT